MYVLKRNLSNEEVSFDKVITRIKKISHGLRVNVHEVAQKVCSRIYDGVKTTELDELAAHICSSMTLEHPDYGTLASRIIISNHQKNTSPSLSETIHILYSNKDILGNPSPLISDELYNIVVDNKEKLNSYIDYSRDFLFDYFGFKTLERAYLLRVNGRVVERPQHMFMRVALGIHKNDIKEALQTYDLMSQKYFIHATPTLFNSGTRTPQLSSCFLQAMESDSIDGIYNTLKDCALISKYAGGIGLHIHNIRGRNAIIRGTNGTSTGVVPMLRVYNTTARYVNQCFTPDTKIYTINGLKAISSLQPFDMVLTNDTTFRRVNQVVKHKINKEILEVHIEHGYKPVKCTKEHQIYCLRLPTHFNPKTCNLNNMNVSPVFLDASSLQHGDYMGFPIPTIVSDARAIDTDFCRFYGLMLNGGEIDHVSNIAELSLSGNVKLETLSFIQQYLTRFNVNYTINNSENTWKISWDSNEAAVPGINLVTMYDINGNKIINSAWMNLPGQKTSSFVNGFIETATKTKNHIYMTVYSENLLLGMRYQLIRLGVLTKGWARINGEARSTEYILEIPLEALNKDIISDSSINDSLANHGYFIWRNIIWTPIVRIIPYNYDGFVYDLNIQDNHNYTTDIGCVHNSGKRNGSIAIYLEPWHTDVEMFIEMRKNHGNEEERARDLFYALWIPDLFMKRVQEGGNWCLMCPDSCKGLSDVYGDEFEKLYTSYEEKGMYVKQIKAQDLWFKILEAQIETGTPYMLYKDHVNHKSNQKNVGIIKSSNLCTEITEYSDDKETAVCNLASFCLPTFIDSNGVFDFAKLHDVVKVVVKNLNKVIDVNFYPIEKAKVSNMRHRPIGLGVQGLADTFAIMKMPFESPQAKQLNKDIFETIYYSAVEASVDLAIKYGPYETFTGSPASQGMLQFDLWKVAPSERYDWKALKERVVLYGMRNSLLVAPMPTASTSQIMGFNEAIEPFTSNIYKRKTLAGEFILVNKYLIRDLTDINMWNSDIKNQIIIHDGSIQNIQGIPQSIKDLYKTVWEVKMRSVIDMAADRGAFVDQSQSMNLFVENPDFKKLSSMHFYSWNKGLKTGMYYLRTKAKAKAQQFTIDPSLSKTTNAQIEHNVCESCSA